MSLQISYAETLREMMASSGKSLNQVVDILKKAPDKLSDSEWIALHKVYRRPKPTYMIGLNENARKFITKRKRTTGIKEPAFSFGLYENPRVRKNWNVSLNSLSISSELSSSARSRAVQESFGFVSKSLTTDISSAFELNIHTSDIILISGPSGSGKSILIRCLIKLLSGNKGKLPHYMNFEAQIDGPKAKCSQHRAPKLNLAPVDQFANCSLETILKLLAITGLAEPHTFVRPAHSLSEGQKYRLGMAVAIADQPDLLFFDEFCEPLDSFSTIAVCKKLRSSAIEFGFGVFVATSRPEFVNDYLRPTVSIKLTSTQEVGVIRHDS